MSNKDVLLELLKKTFEERITALENKSTREIESLTFTKKEFDNFTKKIDTLVQMRKEKEERDRIEKEKKEKEKADKIAKEEKAKKEKMEKSASKGRKSVGALKSSVSVSNFNSTRTTVGAIGRKSHADLRLNTIGNTKPISKRNQTPGRVSKVEPSKGRNTISGNTMTRSHTTANLKKKVEKKVVAKKEEPKPIEKTEEEKNPFTLVEDAKKEEKPVEIEKPKIIVDNTPKPTFNDLLNNQIVSKNIIPYLDPKSQLNLYSTNKKYFKSSLLSLLSNEKDIINNLNNIMIGQTIDDKIAEVIASGDTSTIPEFSFSRGTTKAMALLSERLYVRIFQTNVKYLKQLNQIAYIYRIFCLLIKKDDLAYISRNVEFWKQFSQFVLNSGSTSLSAFFVDNTKNMKFEENILYKINKLYGPFDSSFGSAKFNSICPTTGLVSFLIKDIFEYTGIIVDKKRTPPGMIMKNLEYQKGVLQKIDDYISKLNIISS